jgi:hypothetical protein
MEGKGRQVGDKMEGKKRKGEREVRRYSYMVDREERGQEGEPYANWT